MVPLVFHHHIVDPFDITLTACAEQWHPDTHARLIYDFVLLLLLFILPLTLMTYCYIRISVSLWFVDSSIQTPVSSSMGHPTRFSTLSEDTPKEVRRNVSHSARPYAWHYHRTNDHNVTRLPIANVEDHRPLATSKPLRRNTVLHEIHHPPQTTMMKGRRYSEADSMCRVNQIAMHQQGKPMPIHQRNSISQYNSALFHSSALSLQSQHRILNYVHGNPRSLIDLEHTSRFLRSRRRVVKLLITLGKAFYILASLNILPCFRVFF